MSFKEPPVTDGPHGVFETKDLGLTAFLWCRGFSLASFRHQDERTVFVFDNSTDLRLAILEYTNDGLVGVRTFFNTLRDLKGIVAPAGMLPARVGDEQRV